MSDLGDLVSTRMLSLIWTLMRKNELGSAGWLVIYHHLQLVQRDYAGPQPLWKLLAASGAVA